MKNLKTMKPETKNCENYQNFKFDYELIKEISKAGDTIPKIGKITIYGQKWDMYVQCIFTYIYIYCVCKMYILVQNLYLPKIHIVRMQNVYLYTIFIIGFVAFKLNIHILICPLVDKLTNAQTNNHLF